MLLKHLLNVGRVIHRYHPNRPILEPHEDAILSASGWPLCLWLCLDQGEEDSESEEKNDKQFMMLNKMINDDEKCIDESCINADVNVDC